MSSRVSSSCQRLSAKSSLREVKSYLKFHNCIHVHNDANVRILRRPCFLQDSSNLNKISANRTSRAGNSTYITEMRLFQPTLHNPRGSLAIRCDKLGTDDRSTNELCSVDYFLDARHAERHVHRRDAGKVERLERHLRAWLANRLRANRANRGAWLNLCFDILDPAELQKRAELAFRNLGFVLDDRLVSVCTLVSP